MGKGKSEQEQLDRIREMEHCLDMGMAAVRNLTVALQEYGAAREEMDRLAVYYKSPQWMRDYEDDCAGKLPRDLKRGVLSEDSVHDLLSDREELLSQLRLMLNAERNRV